MGVEKESETETVIMGNSVNSLNLQLHHEVHRAKSKHRKSNVGKRIILTEKLNKFLRYNLFNFLIYFLSENFLNFKFVYVFTILCY